MAQADMLDSEPIPPADWKLCGQALMRQAGRGDLALMIDTYWRESVRKDSDFLIHLMAVVYVESRFETTAISDAGARGLMQMTPVAVAQATKTCKLRELLDVSHMHNSTTNLKYGTCYLAELVDEMEGNWREALIVYNGGYKQLQRYRDGGSMVPETANYVLQIEKILTTTKECHQ